MSRGLVVALLGALLVVVVCPAVLLMGTGGILHLWWRDVDERSARAAPSGYYAAVARRDYAAAAKLLQPPPGEAELAALWARRDVAGPRVVGFTATAVAFDDSGRMGSVTGLLRYADGTSAPQTVRLQRLGDGYYSTWIIISPP